MPEKSVLCPYIAPKPSRGLGTLLIGIHALAFLAAWLNPLPVSLHLLLSAAVLLSAGWHLRRSINRVKGTEKLIKLLEKLFQSQPEIPGLALKSDNSWALTLSTGEIIEASLLGNSILSPWFVLLHFRTEKNDRQVLICRDSLEPDTFRRLRVALRVVTFDDGKK